MENFKKFRQKVKKIVNNSNYGAKVKAKKLAPIVRGWRNYHQFCKLDGPRFNLWSLNNKTWKVLGASHFCKYMKKGYNEKASKTVKKDEIKKMTPSDQQRLKAHLKGVAEILYRGSIPVLQSV